MQFVFKIPKKNLGIWDNFFLSVRILSKSKRQAACLSPSWSGACDFLFNAVPGHAGINLSLSFMSLLSTNWQSRPRDLPQPIAPHYVPSELQVAKLLPGSRARCSPDGPSPQWLRLLGFPLFNHINWPNVKTVLGGRSPHPSSCGKVEAGCDLRPLGQECR